MGNCLAIEEKSMIKIMRIDGKILEYQSPMKVQQLLSDFPGHSISDTLPVVCHLDPMAQMRAGHLYYLLRSEKALPPKIAPSTKEGVVRFKVVISKKELKEMLEREDLTLEETMSQIQRKQIICGNDEEDKSMGWQPDLESIPEGNDIQ